MHFIIHFTARIIAFQMKLDNFKRSQSWCCRILQRSGLYIRTRTTVGQKLPDDWHMKKEAFIKFVKDQIIEKNFDTLQLINMNKVPLSFDCPPHKTVHLKGDKTVNIMKMEMKNCL